MATSMLGQEPITLFLALSALALLPLLAVLVTSFAKISIVLNLTRNALGLQQVPPTIVLNAIALILTAYIMAPVVDAAYDPVSERLHGSHPFDFASVAEIAAEAKAPLVAFMGRHAHDRERAFFMRAATSIWPPALVEKMTRDDLSVLIPAFLMSQVNEAFVVGMVIYLVMIMVDYYVVGGIIFVILCTVQFIVIAKGSERAAEVAARFALDGMPGKQMAIDADVRANMATASEAKKRRMVLSLESKLHGSLDGAMKFVKGDAIAGMVIAVVTFIGGIGVGVGMRGMGAAAAATRYAILTIGDSMVAQIPALLLAVAAGLLITHVGSDESEESSSPGNMILSQLSQRPRGLLIAAVALLICGILPGFPALPFLLVGGLMLTPVLIAHWRTPPSEVTLDKPIAAFARHMRPAPAMLDRTPSVFAHPLVLRLGVGLVQQLHPLLIEARFAEMRWRSLSALGLPFPGVRMLEGDDLREGGFAVQIYEVTRLSSQIPAGHTLLEQAAAVAPQAGPMAQDLAVIDPRWVWVPDALADGQLAQGARVVRLEELFAEAVGRIFVNNAAAFIGVGETVAILRSQETDHPEVIAELNKVMPVHRLAEVLKRLVEERIPLRNIRDILEALVQAAQSERDPLLLVERVRVAIAPHTCQRLANGSGKVHVVLLSEESSKAIHSALAQSRGAYLPMGEEQVDAMVRRVRELTDAAPLKVHPVVLAVQLELRRYLWKLLEPHLPGLVVLSTDELAGAARVVVLGELGMDDKRTRG